MSARSTTSIGNRIPNVWTEAPREQDDLAPVDLARVTGFDPAIFALTGR